MEDTPHSPPENAEPIIKWYRRAQIDYIEKYIAMYIAYNAWYREVIEATSDRQALAQLKKRVIIWDDYINGNTMLTLKVYMERLANLTQAEPFAKNMYWQGYIENKNDWRSLIEYWYQVRCLLVHGTGINPRYVWLAYETLDIFMGEIIERMQKKLEYYVSPVSVKQVLSDTSNETTSNTQGIRQKLYARYFASPNVWQVDMIRAENM